MHAKQKGQIKAKKKRRSKYKPTKKSRVQIAPTTHVPSTLKLLTEFLAFAGKIATLIWCLRQL